jgi:hypothetical protein
MPRSPVGYTPIIVACVASCGGTTQASEANGPGDAAPDSSAQADAPGEADAGVHEVGDSGDVDGVTCLDDLTSNLAGVRIVLMPPKCIFSLAEASVGILFSYQVEVAQDVPGVLPTSQTTGCTPGKSGLMELAEVTGNGQSYSPSDLGPPWPSCQNVATFTLKQGAYFDQFLWPGVNWSGPSDTSNPYGPPFPPGIYTVRVSARGKTTSDDKDFEIAASFTFALVP